MKYGGMPEAMIREVVFEKVKVAATMADLPFLRNHMEVACRLEDAGHRLVLNMQSYVLGKRERTIDVERQWPKDWWEAIKLRFAPQWFLKRWPVQYERISIHEVVWRVCPHVDLKMPDQQQSHFQWLENGR